MVNKKKQAVCVCRPFSIYEKAALRCKAALSIFFRLCSLLRFEVTAQPLLKALHNKAFRYAIMLQRFGRHTLLPTLCYYYMQF